MSAFEYASGLVAIVVGLAFARVLGGIGTFSVARERSGSDWIVVSWCLAILLMMVGWWMSGWTTLRDRESIAFSTLFVWIVATAFIYLAAFVLVPSSSARANEGEGSSLPSMQPAFYLYLAAHFVAAPFLGLAQPIPLANGVGSTTGSSTFILAPVLMAVISASGAALRSERRRAIHLLVWLAVIITVIVGSALTLG